MKDRLLFVNACVRRENSRTLRLARAVIGRFPDHDVEELILEDMGLRPLDSGFLDRRDALIASGDYGDPVFVLARKLNFIDGVREKIWKKPLK